MDSIVAEIIKIIKDAKDSISREESLKLYFENLQCRCVSEALEQIDVELAAAYGKDGWRVEHLDRRTLQASYGTISIRRRRMEKEGEEGIYPLDKELGIRKYQRYTAYLEYNIACLGAKSVYRVAAAAVNALTPVTISHQQVARIVKQVGTKYEEWETAQREIVSNDAVELKRPKVLYIEGDGLMLHGQGTGKREVCRFQIAEGIKEHNGRRELVGTHYVAEFSQSKAKKVMEEYLISHYDLSHTLVLSNSDGGLGYGKEVFDEILGRTGRHEHFRDRYHVNRKCKERVGWAGKKLLGELYSSLREYSWSRVEVVLDTILSTARNELQEEQTHLLKAYLERNWLYLASMEQRGLESQAKVIGTCESNHRTYSYRMKHQGRRWGKKGGSCMVKILTGLKNADLREAMSAREEYFSHAPSQKFHGAVRNALKKAKHIAHEGVRHGRITVNAPTSSAIGQLAKHIA